MRKFFLLGGLLLGNAMLQGAAYTVDAGSNIIAGLITDFSTIANYDVRGAGSLTVTPPGTGIGIFDPVGGTDMGYSGILAYGNSVLFLQAGAEFGALTLSFANPVFSGANLILTGVASGLTPISDPALGAPIANSPLFLTFAFLDSSTVGETGLSLVRWQLTSVNDSAQETGVPEPATVGFVALSTAAIIARRRGRN